MHTAFNGYIDVAQLVLYAFWIFFALLILYLRQEDKREGYPLESDRTVNSGGRIPVIGFPPMPKPKTFLLAHGGTVSVPNYRADTREVRATPVAPHPGAALAPTGDPMLDGVGPASYAERSDTPDLSWEGVPKIVPMRVATDFWLDARDPDPRGMPVVGVDREVGGTVIDIWVDRSEVIARYYEVAVPTPAGTRNVLLPVNFTKVDTFRRCVNVASILGRHFQSVPGIANADTVTLREEDRIMGYYAGGHLYAKPGRMGPWI